MYLLIKGNKSSKYLCVFLSAAAAGRRRSELLAVGGLARCKTSRTIADGLRGCNLSRASRIVAVGLLVAVAVPGLRGSSPLLTIVLGLLAYLRPSFIVRVYFVV